MTMLSVLILNTALAIDGAPSVDVQAVEAPANAVEEDGYARAAALMQDVDALQAEFTQQVVDEAGQLVDESHGILMMSRPNLFRWHYTEPFEQLIVADGSRIWMHDVDLEQVTVRTQALESSRSPLYLLLDAEQLRDVYRLESEQVDAETEVFALHADHAESDFDWAEIGFQKGLLTYLVYADAFGQQTRILFQNMQHNPALEADSFQFSPPPGIDVLGADDLLIETIPLEDQGG